MAMGMLVFMVDFTPLTSHGLPFSLSFEILSNKKNWIVGIQFEKRFFSNWKKVRNFFSKRWPSWSVVKIKDWYT